MGVKIILTNGKEHNIPDVAEVTDKVVEELAKLNIETMVADSFAEQESALISDLTNNRTSNKADVYIPNIVVLTSEPLPATGTSGDYCIITDTQTAYMYMEDHWEALNGNYDATNVYFPDNFKITQSFGKYNVASGKSTTLPWKNKSILDAFKDALSVAVAPVASLPSLTVTWKTFTAKEVGTAISTSSDVVLGTLKVDVGKYTEVVPNQASGVTFNNISIDTYLADLEGNSRNSSYTNVSANTTYDIVWSFDSIPTFDEAGVSFGCYYYGDYTEGAIPTDSLGNDCEDKRISAGTCGTEAHPNNSVTTNNRFIGYRNWWYGYVTNFNTDSNTITRLANGDVTFNGTKLTAANTAAKAGYIPGCSATAGLASGTTNKAFVVVVPTSANLKISGGTSFGVSNVNMDATYFNKITDTNLKINGVNNFEAAQYDILVYNPTDISDMTISYTLGEDK